MLVNKPGAETCKKVQMEISIKNKPKKKKKTILATKCGTFQFLSKYYEH